jgi:hypothetical protein
MFGCGRIQSQMNTSQDRIQRTGKSVRKDSATASIATIYLPDNPTSCIPKANNRAVLAETTSAPTVQGGPYQQIKRNQSNGITGCVQDLGILFGAAGGVPGVEGRPAASGRGDGGGVGGVPDGITESLFCELQQMDRLGRSGVV